MKSMEKKVRQLVKSCPTLLPNLIEKLPIHQQKKAHKIINTLLPRKTGIELECLLSLSNNSRLSFDEIKAKYNLVDYDEDKGSYYARKEDNSYDSECFYTLKDIAKAHSFNEHRIQIKSGLEGMISLYNILQDMRIHCAENAGSGLHYHTDLADPTLSKCPKGENRTPAASFIHYSGKCPSEKYLKMLDHWGYAESGFTYNGRGFGTSNSGNAPWVKYQDGFNTLEYRIGEMSFDYSLIIKRIINCHKVTSVFLKDINDWKQGKTVKLTVDPNNIDTHLAMIKDNFKKWCRKEIVKIMARLDAENVHLSGERQAMNYIGDLIRKIKAAPYYTRYNDSAARQNAGRGDRDPRNKILIFLMDVVLEFRVKLDVKKDQAYNEYCNVTTSSPNYKEKKAVKLGIYENLKRKYENSYYLRYCINSYYFE